MGRGLENVLLYESDQQFHSQGNSIREQEPAIVLSNVSRNERLQSEILTFHICQTLEARSEACLIAVQVFIQTTLALYHALLMSPNILKSPSTWEDI